MKKSVIKRRFDFNIIRVKNLIEIYAKITSPKMAGIKYQDDVLRAAVVMLHATLEDLLRNLEKRNFLTASPEDYVSNGKDMRVLLTDLVQYRKRNVGKVITKVAYECLDRTAYNNQGDLKKSLKRLGISANDYKSDLDLIDTLMKRRHKIAHQTDRHDLKFGNHGNRVSLTKKEVSEWADAIQKFGGNILEGISGSKGREVS